MKEALKRLTEAANEFLTALGEGETEIPLNEVLRIFEPLKKLQAAIKNAEIEMSDEDSD